MKVRERKREVSQLIICLVRAGNAKHFIGRVKKNDRCMTNPKENRSCLDLPGFFSLHAMARKEESILLLLGKANCLHIRKLRKKVENLPDNQGLPHRCQTETRIPEKPVR